MRKSWPEILSAFSIGVGLGAIIGLVFAPQSGEDTRAYIRDKAQGSVEEALAGGKKMMRRAQKLATDAREVANEATEAGENAFRQARNS